MQKTLLLAAGILLLCLVGSCKRDGQAPRYGQAQVTLNGHTWRVEMALTAQARYRGLSGRGELDKHSGMLFIYPQPRVLYFCMRDCDWPLDIAFLDAEGRIVSMTTMQVEPDRRGEVLYGSQDPAQYVLEVRSGSLQGTGAKAGDKVVFSAEVPPAAKAEAGP